MNKRVTRVLSTLVPLGIASALIPLQDSPRPIWLAAPLLLLFVRVLSEAFDYVAGSSPSLFRCEEQVYAAPFALRLLALLAASGVWDLVYAATTWFVFGAAAYTAEAAFAKTGGKAPAVFAVALTILGATAAAAADLSAVLSGAVLSSVVFLYQGHRRRSR